MSSELSEGIYIIPKQYKVIVSGNEVHVLPRKVLKEYRCKDCEYRQEGYATINAYHKSLVCKQRPKKILNPNYCNQTIFYCAPYYGRPCKEFKLKGGDSHERRKR